MVLLAYSARTGRQQWVRFYGGPDDGPDRGQVIAVSPDSSAVYVAASSAATRNHYGKWASSLPDYLVLAYGAADGGLLWKTRWDGSANGRDDPSGIQVTPDGEMLVVTGTSDAWPIDDDDLVSVGITTRGRRAGVLTWVSRFDGGTCVEQANDLVMSPDGSRFYVAGEISASRQGCMPLEDSPEISMADAIVQKAFGTVAYRTTSGKKLWAARYSGAPGGSHDYATAIDVDPSGTRVYVTGVSWPNTDFSYSVIATPDKFEMATIAYGSKTGELEWVYRFRPGWSVGMDISVGPSGSVYVGGGYSPAPVGIGYSGLATATTWALDGGTGRPMWTAMYRQPDRPGSISMGIALRTSGDRVYSAQRFGPALVGEWPNSDLDYGVVIYAQ